MTRQEVQETILLRPTRVHFGGSVDHPIGRPLVFTNKYSH
jgi:hypothetical protein